MGKNPALPAFGGFFVALLFSLLLGAVDGGAGVLIAMSAIAINDRYVAGFYFLTPGLIALAVAPLNFLASKFFLSRMQAWKGRDSRFAKAAFLGALVLVTLMTLVQIWFWWEILKIPVGE